MVLYHFLVNNVTIYRERDSLLCIILLSFFLISTPIVFNQWYIHLSREVATVNNYIQLYFPPRIKTDALPSRRFWEKVSLIANFPKTKRYLWARKFPIISLKMFCPEKNSNNFRHFECTLKVEVIDELLLCLFLFVVVLFVCLFVFFMLLLFFVLFFFKQ